jgi:hypothetical protein
MKFGISPKNQWIAEFFMKNMFGMELNIALHKI